MTGVKGVAYLIALVPHLTSPVPQVLPLYVNAYTDLFLIFLNVWLFVVTELKQGMKHVMMGIKEGVWMIALG